MAAAEVRWFSASDPVPGWEEAQLSGDHNRANLAAGILASSRFEISDETIAGAVRSFPGVPYRQELVREAGGIRYVNDSTATTPDATQAALATIQGPIVLIAGGSDKGLSYLELATRIDRLGDRIRRVVLLPGDGTDALASLLPTESRLHVKHMEDAVREARRAARAGDTVLLSPACASFGQFANEFDRGDQFNQAVAKLDDR